MGCNSFDIDVLRRAQGLTGEQYGLLRDMLKGGVTSTDALNQVVKQIAQDRLLLAQGKLALVRSLLDVVEKECGESPADASLPNRRHERTVYERHQYEMGAAISLAYYAMYHAARAVIFDVGKRDVDDHKKVAREIGLQLRRAFRDERQLGWTGVLDQHRKWRNEVDYSPYPRLLAQGARERTLHQPSLLYKIAKRAWLQAVPLIDNCEKCLKGGNS